MPTCANLFSNIFKCAENTLNAPVTRGGKPLKMEAKTDRFQNESAKPDESLSLAFCIGCLMAGVVIFATTTAIILEIMPRWTWLIVLSIVIAGSLIIQRPPNGVMSTNALVKVQLGLMTIFLARIYENNPHRQVRVFGDTWIDPGPTVFLAWSLSLWLIPNTAARHRALAWMVRSFAVMAIVHASLAEPRTLGLLLAARGKIMLITSALMPAVCQYWVRLSVAELMWKQTVFLGVFMPFRIWACDEVDPWDVVAFSAVVHSVQILFFVAVSNRRHRPFSLNWIHAIITENKPVVCSTLVCLAVYSYLSSQLPWFALFVTIHMTSCCRRTKLMMLIVAISSTILCGAFSPPSNFELESAVEICLEASPEGACTNDLYGPIGDWDVSLVADMSSLFLGKASFNGDLSKWNISRVGDMNSLFLCATSFNGHISKWDVSRVTDMNSLFDRAASYNRDLSKWDVSRVINMDNMFANAKSFNGDIAKWDVSRVTSMQSMFNDAKSFSGDVSKWDVSRVTSMESMFNDAQSFDQTLCRSVWVHSKADKSQMFTGSSGSICLTTPIATTTTTMSTIYTNGVIVYLTIGVAVVFVAMVVAAALIAALWKKKISSNMKPLAEPLLPVNTPDTPNKYQRQQRSLAQPERLSVPLPPDKAEARSTPTPKTGVNIELVEINELEEFPDYLLAGDTVQQGSCISVTLPDMFDETNPRASDQVFGLVAVNFKTLKAARATLFNIHSSAAAEAMTAFVATLGKDEIVVAVGHDSIPSKYSRMIVKMLRSLRSVSGSVLHVLDSPYVQMGPKHQYIMDGLMHANCRSVRADVAMDVRDIWIPLDIVVSGVLNPAAKQAIAAMRRDDPAPMRELETTHRDERAEWLAMMDRPSRRLPGNNEWRLLDNVTAEMRLRQAKSIAHASQNLPGVILVMTDMQSHLGIDGDVLGVTGYTPNEFLSLDPTRDFLSPTADGDELALLFASVVDPKVSFVEITIPHVHKEGHTIWLRACHGTRVIGATANGNPEVLVVFSDVTAMVVAQRKALAMRDALLRRMAFLPAMIYEMVVDDATGTGRIVYANRQSMRIFGLTPDEMTCSCEWMQMLHPDDVERYESSMADSEATMQEWDHEFRVVVQGETKHLHGRALPHREGISLVWSGVLQDVTARHNHRNMANTSEIKKAIDERLNAACAFLSHEIRNQLHPQSVVLERIKDEEPKWAHSIDMILDANKTATTILEQMFDLAKWESGEFPINVTRFPIARLFKTIAAYAEVKSVAVKGLAFTMPTWYARADEQLLKQAAINLVSNASKFSDGSPVVIMFAFEQTNDKEGVIVVSVTDKGRGMTPDQLTKAMVPFGHLHKGREACKGAGLGLPLTKAIVEVGHKGTLALKSEGLGKGTAATMRVPVLWEDQGEKPRPELDDPLWWVSPHPGVTADVLVVGDVKMARMAVTFAAKKLGLRVQHAVDGTEAVERMRANTFSIVFMDYQMPKMNGDVATERARANGYALPIVMVSGDTFSASEKAELIGRGMTAFLNKMAVPGVRHALLKLNEMM